MSEGFKIAGAYVEVALKDRTDADLQQLRERVQTAKPFELPTELGPPSDEETRKTKEKTEKQPPIELPTKLKDPVDEEWKRKVNTDLRAAARDLAKLPVDADTEQLRRAVAEKVKEINATLKADIPIDLADAVAWREKVRAEVDKVARSVRDQIKSEPPAEVPTKLSDPVNDAWKSKVKSELAAAARELNELPIHAGTEELRREITTKIQEIQSTLKADIPVDASDATALRAKVAAEVAAIEHSIKAHIPVEVDDSSLRRAQSTAQNTGRALSSSIGSGSASAGSSLSMVGRFAAIGLGAIPALAAAAAGAIAAIGPAAAGVAGIIGSLAGAWSGVAGALKGYAADQKAAESASAGGASSQLSDAMAIRDATRAIADAKKEQARTYQDAADSITAAERRVEDAQRAETDAQQALTDARRAAAEQLAEYERRVADAALNEEGASLAVEAAQERLRKTLSSPLATDLEKRQAAFDVKAAQQRLNDLKAEDAKLRRDAAEAQTAGVEGDKQVVDAKDRVTQATRDTMLAQQELARARQDAADQMAKADEQVTRAIEHLSDVEAQQAAAAGAAGGGVSQFALAMAKLTPEARALVGQLISMKPLWDDLSATAQREMLPGFTKMFKDSIVLFPIFKSAIKETSAEIGGLASRAGDLFQSPVFQGQLAQNFANSMPVLKAAGDVGLQLFGDIIKLGSEARPVTDALADGLHILGDGIGDLFDALAPAMDSFGGVLRAVFRAVGELLGPIGELVGMFADALAPILGALVPVVRSLAEAILKVAGPILDALSPALTHIIENCLQPLADLLGDQLGKLLPPLAEAFGQWWMVLAKLTEPLTTLITALLPPLVDLAVRWLEAFQPIWPEMQKLATVIAEELSKAITEIAPHLPEMAENFMKIVEAVAPHIPQLIELAAVIAGVAIPAVAWFVTGLLELNETIVGPVGDAIAWAIDKIPAAWEWIKTKTREHIDMIRVALEFFASLPGRMWDWINRTKDAAVERFWSLVEWVYGLPGRLLSALGDLGSLAAGKGQDFVRGIWNGISSMGSWLYNKVWDWVKQQIPGPVKDALGIHSPSKVAEDLAREVPAGIVVGLDGGSRDVERASLRLASTVQSGLGMGGDGAALPDTGAAPLGLGAASVGTGGTVISIQQLIVQVQGVVDLTDPIAMDAAARDFVVRLREALRTVEASQA